MTIINEVMNYEKYYHLRYIEFLEMLCRVALKADLPGNPQGSFNRIKFMLEFLLKRMQDNRVEEFELMRIQLVNREMKDDRSI